MCVKNVRFMLACTVTLIGSQLQVVSTLSTVSIYRLIDTVYLFTVYRSFVLKNDIDAGLIFVNDH